MPGNMGSNVTTMHAQVFFGKIITKMKKNTDYLVFRRQNIREMAHS